jgi:hypothetical protein
LPGAGEAAAAAASAADASSASMEDAAKIDAAISSLAATSVRDDDATATSSSSSSSSAQRLLQCTAGTAIGLSLSLSVVRAVHAKLEVGKCSLMGCDAQAAGPRAQAQHGHSKQHAFARQRASCDIVAIGMHISHA